MYVRFRSIIVGSITSSNSNNSVLVTGATWCQKESPENLRVMGLWVHQQNRQCYSVTSTLCISLVPCCCPRTS